MTTTTLNGRTEYFKEQFDHHLRRSLAVIGLDGATQYERYLAIAYTVRDELIDRWAKTQKSYYDNNVKRVYYLSLEFLMGRTLGNAILNLNIEDEISDALNKLGIELEDLREAEVDAGLGNGGLGRLAACFIDSMATLEIPAYGMGIRYEYGMFNQQIENKEQIEKPDNWLRLPNPWEIARPQYSIQVPFGGHTEEYTDEFGQTRKHWVTRDHILAMPYDTPVPGYDNQTVNNLRLWSARSSDDFGLEYFNNGDYLEAIKDMELSESISKVLYPNDTSVNGKELRLKQQYFLVCASLHDMLRRYKKTNDSLDSLPDKVALQLNDTHPAVAIPELMRILVDLEGLSWKKSWDICTRVFAYTNHTLLPEALEKWSVSLFEKLLPRHLEIIYEINSQFLRLVSLKWPGDVSKLREMSLVEEGNDKFIRMAFLSIVGSHAVNGVAALHTKLLKSNLFLNFYKLWPEKFQNKTNGVTQRRWLRKSNPGLSDLISAKIGDKWVKDLDELKKLEQHTDDKKFILEWQKVKQANKQRLTDYLKKHQGISLNPQHMFDVQVKRIHEYKRQMLCILHAVHLYLEIKDGKKKLPRTILIGGKAAPAYWMAKQIIKLTNYVAEIINTDPDTKDVLNLHFLENYRVSLAEKIFPASDLSEQISTAGKEASGTGNMKFALNGALTIGTLDGANVEIEEEVGSENIFIFGKTVDEIQALEKSGYQPWEEYNKSKALQRVLDLIDSGFFNPEDPNMFKPVLDNLLRQDPFFVLADFDAYIKCQEEVEKVYLDSKSWTQKAILNVARMGLFSTDRTISQYNNDIWNAPTHSISL
jgi:starch phosphorylase